MFLVDLLLNTVEGVTFTYYLIMIKYKTLESIIYFLELSCSKVIGVYEALGVVFVLTSFGMLIGLLLS